MPSSESKVWFIIASGPSLTSEDVDAVRGMGTVIAVNNAVFKAPWADYLYAVDKRWWDQYNPEWFDGQKLTLSRFAFRWGAKRLNCQRNKPGFGKRDIRMGGSGANSGFHAVNYALLHNPKSIALLGFDHQHTNGQAHFHGDHPDKMPNARNVDKWVEAMETASNDTNGTKLVNCSRETALNCFERMSIQDFISEYC